MIAVVFLRLLFVLFNLISVLAYGQTCGTTIKTEHSLIELAQLYIEVKNSKALGGPMASLLEKAFAEKVQALAEQTGMSPPEVIQKLHTLGLKKLEKNSIKAKRQKDAVAYRLVSKIQESVMGDDPYPQKSLYFKESDVLMVPSYQGVQFYSPGKGLSTSFIINVGFDYFYSKGSKFIMLKAKTFAGGETSFYLVDLNTFDTALDRSFGVSFQQAKDRVFVEQRDGSAKVIDLKTGTIIFDRSLPDFSAASLHPDGNVLFYQKNSKQGVFVDIQTKQIIKTITLPQKFSPVRFVEADFSADGQYLVLRNHSSTVVLDLTKDKVIKVNEHYYFREFTSDGKAIRFDNGLFKLPRAVKFAVTESETNIGEKEGPTYKVRTDEKNGSSMVLDEKGQLIGIVAGQRIEVIPNTPYIMVWTEKDIIEIQKLETIAND